MIEKGIARVLAVAALLLIGGCGSSASTSFTVTHEVLLESGTPLTPYSIDRTPDDGYIIVGGLDSVERRRNVVIKTDAQGNSEWRYALASEDGGPDVYSPKILAALPMQSGHWLLCGDVFKKPRGAPIASFAGLLVELDGTGNVVAKREFVPQGDAGYSTDFVYTCTRWNDAFVVLASAIKYTKGASPRIAYWIVSLSAEGQIEREQLIKASLTNLHGFSRPRILANGDMVLEAWQSGEYHATELVRVDSSGRVAQQQIIDGVYWLVRATEASMPVRLVSVYAGDGTTKSLLTLDGDLNVRERPIGPVPNNNAALAYEMRDGSIVIFGSHHTVGRDDANIVKWGPDLQHNVAEFRFEAALVRTHSATITNEAVPTVAPNEFATIRMYVTAANASGTYPEAGMRLAFVRLR